MTEFTVRGEYITLGQILKAEGIAGGGGDIKHFLAEGGILVNDEPENRRGAAFRDALRKRESQILRRLKSISRFLFQAVPANLAHAGGNTLRQFWRILPLAREQFVQNYAEAEDVGAGIDIQPAHLFGRHVSHRAHDCARLGVLPLRRREGSLATSAGRIFNATSRPSRVSRARYTSPIPPAPRGETIS